MTKTNTRRKKKRKTIEKDKIMMNGNDSGLIFDWVEQIAIKTEDKECGAFDKLYFTKTSIQII